MVTRNIKANTATQVNSNLIGVLVHPGPPIVTLTESIIVDYTYTKIVINTGVPIPGKPGQYTPAFTDNNNDVYWFTGEEFFYAGDNHFQFVLWPQDNTVDNSVWLKFPSGMEPDPGSNLFKIDRTDPENPVITDAGITFRSLFINAFDISNINFIQIDASNIYNGYFGSNYYVNGDFLIDTNTYYKVGYVVSGPAVVTEPDVTFTKGGLDEDYQTWTNNDVKFGKRVLYTPTDSPSIGDTALFTLNNGGEYNPQTIKSINIAKTPVDCKLSYSVDGSTWTDWPENITDDNSVISNIPRYMYLKFSQDVVITEE